MRNAESWAPSKYVQRNGRLRASLDRAEVGIGSRLITDRIAALYEQHLPTYARGRLVDLGCGKAPLYGQYRPWVTQVTCVDWPQSAHDSLHLDREVDLGAALPFADASFDTVLLSDVLEHVPDPTLLWAEMARVLAPGGHALVNVPFLYGVHEAPHDYARYTEFGLRRFARMAGLGVPLLLPVGGSLHVLADLLAKHLAHMPLMGGLLARGVQSAVAAFDRTGSGRRIAARTGERFPLGYFLVAARPPA